MRADVNIVKGVAALVLGIALSTAILVYGPSMDTSSFQPLLGACTQPKRTRTIIVLAPIGGGALSQDERTRPMAHNPRIIITAKGFDDFDGTHTTDYEVGEWEKDIARKCIAEGGWTHYQPADEAKAYRHRRVIGIIGVDNEFDGFFAKDGELDDWEKELAKAVIELMGDSDTHLSEPRRR